MTAVDFERFVEQLADVAAEAILPFFRTAIAAEDKAHGGAFDPVTEADRAAEIAMRRLIEATFPAMASSARSSRPRRRRICLGARSDRRHQELYLRLSDLGHADRPDA